MATIGVKEAQRKAMREAKNQTTRAMVAAVDGPKKVEPPPPARPAEESSVVKKAKKKPAPKAKAKPPKIAKAKAAKPAKKVPAAKGVDRSPLTVGNFIVNAEGGRSMAELEKQFKMDAHPLRSKIFTAKHRLGFTIEYDAKEKRYTGQAPRFKAAAE